MVQQTPNSFQQSFLITLVLSVMITLSACSFGQAQGIAHAEQLAERGLGLARSGHYAEAEAELRRAVLLAPHDPQLLGDLAAVVGNEGKLRDAATYFRKAVKLDPQDLTLRRELAATEVNLGEEMEAETDLKYVLRRDHGDREATLLLAMAAANRKEYRRALALFGTVPAVVQQQPNAVAALARCYYHTGQAGQARQLLLGALKSPESPQEIFLAGEMAEEARDGPTAERLFNSIRTTYPDFPRLQFHLADAEYESGQYAESQSLLDRLIGSGHGTSEAFNLLGRCHAKEGHMTRARKALETAISVAPSDEANYSDLTTILLTHKELPAALLAAKWWAKTFPSSERAISTEAAIEMQLHFYKQAANSYQLALKLQPSSEVAALGIAKAEAAAGLESKAEISFQTGIHRFPKAEPFYREYGRTLLQLSVEGTPGTKRRAATMLEKAVRLDSSDWEARYSLGKLRLSEGNTRAALPELLAAARLSPNESKIHLALWRAYSELGRKAQAGQQLDMFRHLQHTDPMDKASTDAR